MLQRYTTLRRFSILTACIASLLAVTTTHAQTDTTWTRGAGNGDWNNATNWSAGVPVAGFNAIFGASVGGSPSQIITLAMDKITFATGGASYTAQFQNLAMHFDKVITITSPATEVRCMCRPPDRCS